jgi:hypothetical protein
MLIADCRFWIFSQDPINSLTIIRLFRETNA